MKAETIKFEIASNVSTRDGIGIEVYRNDEMILEIFRDESDKTRTVTVFDKVVSLELLEQSIQVFKEKIEQDFIDYDN